MKVAILSDIHDNIWRLATLLEGLEAETLIFCGDFCAPFTLDQIAREFEGPIHAVLGNNDGDQLLLSRVAGKHPHVTLHGQFAELELDGRRVAVSHYPEVGRAIAQAGTYDLVCHGHSHERLVAGTGQTVRVNPGEVMGRKGPSTYAIYDTERGEAEIVEVEK
jgi:putative phosphoesterase